MMTSIRLLCVLFFLLNTATTNAQSNKLPPFKMVLANGEIFKAQDLPLGKPIVIIYFSPECDHCQILMKDVTKNKARFKKASVAMVTHVAVSKVLEFAQQYNMKSYKNFYVGTEGTTYFLKNYYHLTQMPFMALYTKNGDLVKTYQNESDVKALIQKLNSL